MDAILTQNKPLITVVENILDDLIRWLATVYTQDGEEVVIDLIDVGGYFIGWGTGVVGADKADSDLGIASTESRVAGTPTQPSADIIQWVGTITSGSGQDISEVGLFDGAGSGNPPTGDILMIRSDFTPITLGNGDKIEFTISLEQT